MTTYIIRRLLLIIPTFFGTTMLVFWILNITPDGPFEQEINRIKQAKMQNVDGGAGGGGVDDKASIEVDEDVIKAIEREYGLDKPLWHRYLIWLGLAPKEIAYVEEHEPSIPYTHTIKEVGKIDGQPVALQKYIFPIMDKDNELTVYESKEGANYPNFEEYYSLEEVNFDAAGFIPKIMIAQDLELYTIKKIGGTDSNPVLLQKYFYVGCNECDEENYPDSTYYVIYESEEGTNIDFKEYNKIPGLEDEKRWDLNFEESKDWTAKKTESDCIIKDGQTCEASLSLNKKGDLLNDENFKDHWVESDWTAKEIDNNMIELSFKKHEGIFQGYLGESSEIDPGKSVSQLIFDRLHISAFFGITGFVLSYLVCIPLGIMKALRHGSKFDITSSFVVFIGYSIPAYAFGVLMIWFFASTSSPFIEWGIFEKPVLPSRGWRPENWESLSFWGKIFGQLEHAFLPTFCYMLSSFASLTVLMKNSLMENMSQDYVRTAFAKGLVEKTVIFKHAVRNSLIPLATGIGGLIGIFLAGSYLIEKVFGIEGIGKLGFDSIAGRDFGVFLGFLVIGTIIRLVGNLLSDVCYAAIDPRIRFK